MTGVRSGPTSPGAGMGGLLPTDAAPGYAEGPGGARRAPPGPKKKERGKRETGNRNPPDMTRALGNPGGLYQGLNAINNVSGDVLLSHTLSGAVPSPCKALASGFGMGPGVSPWLWSPQIFNNHHPPGAVACGGPGTGQWTRISFRDQTDAPCRGNKPKDAIRATPKQAWCDNVIAFPPLVPVSSTPYGASTSGLSTTCSAWGVTRPRGPRGILISEQASRLDAFSGYPFRT